ncbi:MAG: helix-turn-helix transcriptional regulator [Thermoplasmata archaeon]|nr:helix-turn-helix transcriptional regulator [Thermoplasmata archaeon]
MNEDSFLKCIVDSNRRRILMFVGQGEKCVTELVELTGMEQSLVSHHLRSLRDCGLVRSRRHGKKILYNTSSSDIVDLLSRIREVADSVKELAEGRECV